MDSSESECARKNEFSETRLNTTRGAVYAVGLGLVGALTTGIFLIAYGCWVPKQIMIPAIGVGFMLAGTGWATFAPRGNYSFAWTLAIIFIISVPLWFVIGNSIPRPMEKFSQQPLYLYEILFLGGPPLSIGFILSLIRRKKPGCIKPEENRHDEATQQE